MLDVNQCHRSINDLDFILSRAWHFEHFLSIIQPLARLRSFKLYRNVSLQKLLWRRWSRKIAFKNDCARSPLPEYNFNINNINNNRLFYRSKKVKTKYYNNIYRVHEDAVNGQCCCKCISIQSWVHTEQVNK